MALPTAGGPAIFRAAQKDEYFAKQLGGSASEVLRLFGNRKWQIYSKYIPFASHLAYNSITTLRDLQTLGEEYTGIIQVDNSYVQIPAKLIRMIYILLGAFGHQAVTNILNRTKESVLKNKSLLPKPKTLFLKVISLAHWSLPILQELHQACFFLGAKHYNITKRLTQINYVSAVPGRRPRISTLRTLGVPYLMRALLSAVQSPPSFEDIEPKNKRTLQHSRRTACDSCLITNNSPCCLPCGHIFCHNCARSLTICAICRAPYQNHRAVPLQNYNLRR